MKSDTSPDPERLHALLVRRVADRLGRPAMCQARGCRRSGRCSSPFGSDPPCRQTGQPEDRTRFDELLRTVEAIRSLTLWPEPSRNDDLRATEAMAIDILKAALPLMPDFAPKFEAWLARYNKWPKGPRDARFWMKLAKEEIGRWREVDRKRGELDG